VKTKFKKIYELNSKQNSAIVEAREQIKNDYLTNEEASQEIDEWLNN